MGEESGMGWLMASTFAAVLFGVNIVLTKVLLQMEVSRWTIIQSLYVVGAVVITVRNCFDRSVPIPPMNMLALILLPGIISLAGMYCQVEGIVLAPNPGLAGAIIACSAVVAVAGGVMFLNLPVTLTQIAGVLFCMVGIALLAR